MRHDVKSLRTWTLIVLWPGVLFGGEGETTTEAAAADVGVLLQKAVFTEETVGDLDTAIDLYRKIVEQQGGNRSDAARARYRLGLCYLKKGATLQNEAAAIFRELIESYPEEKGLVTQARRRLSELESSARPSEQSGIVIRRVWQHLGLRSNYGNGSRAAPSPDGRYLAYRNVRTGDLMLRDLTSGATRRLTRNERGSKQKSKESPSFRRDGKEIAYAWGPSETGSYDLWVVDADGSSPPRLLYHHEDVARVAPKGWTPDGEQILTRIDRKDGTRQIAMLAVVDGSLRVLKSFPWGYPQMRLSPNGRYVAYDFPQRQDRNEPRDIFVLATDGTKLTRNVDHPLDDRLLDWAPEGNRILFRSPRLGFNDDLWIVDVTSKGLQSPRLLKQSIGPRIPTAHITEDGVLHYLRRIDLRDIYVARVDPVTGRVDAQAEQINVAEPGVASSFDWLAGKAKLAYFYDNDDLRIHDLETGEERELQDLPRADNPHLRSSPDGRSILLRGYHDDRYGLYRVDTETKEILPVVHANTIGRGVWSKDGKSVYYNTGEGRINRIVSRHLGSGEERELHRATQPIGPTLALSPAGDHLAFPLRWTKAQPAIVLHIVPVTGGESREVMRVNVRGAESMALTSGLGWSADGRHLLFWRWRDARRDPTIDLWRVAVSGGDPEQLAISTKRTVTDLRVHADGRHIGFAARRKTDELWTMANFLPKASSR